MHFDDVSPVLTAVAIAAAADKPLDPIALSGDVGRELDTVIETLEILERNGLFLRSGDEYGHVPVLLHAGTQYLAAHGAFADEDVEFLSSVIDDLHARAALRIGTTILADRFRGAVIGGEAVKHAQQLVPPAFAAAVDMPMAINLFAAAVVLGVRLGLGRPAGCLAEEVLAVEALSIAAAHLEMQRDTGALTAVEAEHARAEFRGIFELFEDDDVLDLFYMAEPADAALAGHTWIHQQMGKVDQRLESWFRPFGFVSETGYYWPRGRNDDDSPGPIPGPN